MEHYIDIRYSSFPFIADFRLLPVYRTGFPTNATSCKLKPAQFPAHEEDEDGSTGFARKNAQWLEVDLLSVIVLPMSRSS